MKFRTLPAVAAVLIPLVASAQDSTAREAPHHVMVGSGEENYLRYLQDAGLAALYPWSLREFSQKELAKLAVKPRSHPWSGKGDYTDYPARFSFKILPVNVVFRFNSAFPYGSNDGAVWAGRGLTSAIDIGFAFRTGPLSATFNPIAFRAENQAFSLQPMVITGTGVYADPLFPTSIDRPQRFGRNAYARVDPGETTIRLDLLGLTAGASTANMGWGPMEVYPYIIGANAAGFPHAFVGTSEPLPVWIGKIHGRVMWGELQQSTYSPVTGTRYYSSALESGTKRFMSGIVGVFEPRGIPGLEFGGARFFHLVWPRTGIPRSYFTKPLEAIFKIGLGDAEEFVGGTDPAAGDNQLASIFARWQFPGNAFEIYGEYGREDHSADLRDFLQEPDHSRTYGLGFRKVMRSDSLHLSALRAELINYELPTLARHRGEGQIYIHGLLRQGHTNRGQLLGSNAGIGTGAGSLLAWDKFDAKGRTTFLWIRTINQQSGTYYFTGAAGPSVNDVSHVLSAEQSRFVRRGEIGASLSVIRELNRQFVRDEWNLNSIVGVRMRF